jgi:RNA polymerase sigma-70 factor (ECF subfamily)
MTESEPSDEELVRLVQGGDLDQYRGLVRRHKNYVFGLIQRQIDNSAITEDLAQDVFIRAYRAIGSFRHEALFRTWLTRIAFNVVKNYFQSSAFKKQRRTSPIDSEEQVGRVAYVGSVEQSLEQKQFLSLLLECVAFLPSKLREVLTLCAFEEQSYEYAAEVLEIPTGTVRSRLNRARLGLKDCIRKQDEGY